MVTEAPRTPATLLPVVVAPPVAPVTPVVLVVTKPPLPEYSSSTEASALTVGKKLAWASLVIWWASRYWKTAWATVWLPMATRRSRASRSGSWNTDHQAPLSSAAMGWAGRQPSASLKRGEMAAAGR